MRGTAGASSRPAEPAAATEHPPFAPSGSQLPGEQLVDLRRLVAATRWPESETGTDQSQGAQLATNQEVARYRATDSGLWSFEARQNAVPQFMIEIEGLNIHFICVCSRHDDALPLR